MATIWSIPFTTPFLDALAAGLLARGAEDPLKLADRLVLLPSRRACLGLREALLRAHGGRALLLPRMQPMSTLDGDEQTLLDAGIAADHAPGIAPLRRQFLLAQLVGALGSADGGQVPIDQALRLAEALGQFLDEAQAHDVDLATLATLVPEDLAVHWQRSRQFLTILAEQWPGILAAQGASDRVARQTTITRAVARSWQTAPPAFPITVAGIASSLPATRALIGAVLSSGRGELILPGFDAAAPMHDDALAAHPQAGMHQLIRALGYAPDAVEPWPYAPNERPAETPPGRISLWHETMRPARALTAWRDLAARLDRHAFDGLNIREVADLPGEARLIAAHMRAALEIPGRTCAMVSPNRTLARRVAIELKRFGIDIDDSGGVPLDQTAPAGLVLHAAHLACSDDPSPVRLLELLKHPLCQLGYPREILRRRARNLETEVLRGPRPGNGLNGVAGELERLIHRLQAQPAAKASRIKRLRRALDLVERLQAACAPLRRLPSMRPVPLADLLDAHLAVVDAIARGTDGDSSALYAQEAGIALAACLEDLRAQADAAPMIAPAAYPGALSLLMAAINVRPARSRHARLHIWGPLEARLQRPDVVFLAGLNEGVWPSEITPGPWLGADMRSKLGLPPLETTLGLAAHDLLGSAFAPEVVLTRAQKDEDGNPTVPSRWLVRLKAVAKGVDPRPEPALLDHISTPKPFEQFALELDAPNGPVTPCQRPAPRPPVAARPRELWATDVELWRRDPYSLYARRILCLKELDALDADPGGLERGKIIHDALERYCRKVGAEPPKDAWPLLRAAGEEAFKAYAFRPQFHRLWWPRFERIANWFLAEDGARRAAGSEISAEIEGLWTCTEPGGPFTLKARADRLELGADGACVVVDYKTGAPPTAKEVLAGYAPQLPLEALIAQAGGFPGRSARRVTALEYWQLRGGEPVAGEIADALNKGLGRGETAPPVADVIARAQTGLRAMIRAFDQPDQPYLARPQPQWYPKHSPYAHLARVAEWASVSDDDEA